MVGAGCGGLWVFKGLCWHKRGRKRLPAFRESGVQRLTGGLRHTERASGNVEMSPCLAGRQTSSKRVTTHATSAGIVNFLGAIKGLYLFCLGEEDLCGGQPFDDVHGAVAERAGYFGRHDTAGEVF